MSWNRVCVDYQGPCADRVRAVSVGQGTVVSPRLQLVRRGGTAPEDLSAWGIAPGLHPSHSDTSLPFHGVRITVRESDSSPAPWFQLVALVADAADAAEGTVTLPLQACHTGCPGIWLGTAAVYQEGVRRLNFPFLYEVTPSLEDWNASGPLTLHEIRLITGDVCADGNRLIDDVEYTDEQIAYMAKRAVDFWNEQPPPIAHFTPATFPFRYAWSEAVVGELLRSEALRKLRDHLPYNAGGVTVDDTGKWRDYLRIGEEKLAVWRQFVGYKKRAINLGRGFGGLSGYPARRWW